jgi:hypothetical protein
VSTQINYLLKDVPDSLDMSEQTVMRNYTSRR